MCIGIGLALVWIAMWAAHVFAGRPTPVDPETFKIVAALDLALMVPALTAGAFGAGTVSVALQMILQCFQVAVAAAASGLLERDVVALFGRLLWALSVVRTSQWA